MKPIFNLLPQSSFWDELNQKVVEIGERTRSRQRRIDLSEPKDPRKRQLSRFQIERDYHEQVEEEKRITNRLSYLETERQKRSKALEQAKQKYQRVMEIRSKSIREKKQSKEIIAENQRQLSRNASKRVTLIKKNREKVHLSVQKIKELHELSAKQIRSSSLENHEASKAERQKEIQQKRELVSRMHQTLQLSRCRNSAKRQEVAEKAKLDYHSYLQGKAKVNQSRQLRNSFLKQKLHESLMTCYEDRQRDLQQIKTYASLFNREKSMSRKITSVPTTSC